MNNSNLHENLLITLTIFLQNLKTTKDKINISDNVEYKINCTNCDKHYIGYTINWLTARLYHHKISLKPK